MEKNTFIKSPIIRDAIFPDFLGFPDFNKSKLSIKTYNFNNNLKDVASYCGFNGEDVASDIS